MDLHLFHSFLCFLSLCFDLLFVGFQPLSERSEVGLKLMDFGFVLRDILIELIDVGIGLYAGADEFAAAVVGIALYHFIHIGFIDNFELDDFFFVGFVEFDYFIDILVYF